MSKFRLWNRSFQFSHFLRAFFCFAQTSVCGRVMIMSPTFCKQELPFLWRVIYGVKDGGTRESLFLTVLMNTWWNSLNYIFISLEPGAVNARFWLVRRGCHSNNLFIRYSAYVGFRKESPVSVRHINAVCPGISTDVELKVRSAAWEGFHRHTRGSKVTVHTSDIPVSRAWEQAETTVSAASATFLLQLEQQKNTGLKQTLEIASHAHTSHVHENPTNCSHFCLLA